MEGAAAVRNRVQVLRVATRGVGGGVCRDYVIAMFRLGWIMSLAWRHSDWGALLSDGGPARRRGR